jgi:hypothetical protein
VPADALARRTSPFIIEIIDELARECEPDIAKELVREGFSRLAELECAAARGAVYQRDIEVAQG